MDSLNCFCDAVVYHSVMALRKVKGSLERVLDKNMQDLVRGLRNNKEQEVR